MPRVSEPATRMQELELAGREPGGTGQQLDTLRWRRDLDGDGDVLLYFGFGRDEHPEVLLGLRGLGSDHELGGQHQDDRSTAIRNRGE